MPEPPTRRIASYEADPEQVGRVLLLYSGGLDTSVMLRWIQERYGAEIVTLTVDLGPARGGLGGGDRKGARPRCARRDPRRRPRGVRARIRAAGDQGQRSVRRRLPTVHGARAAADRQARRRARPPHRLRHDRPRLHRQGQRPGADRGDGGDARPRARGDRAGARVADGARGGGRLRSRARDPGQGRNRGAALLDRRQPLGSIVGGRGDRGPGLSRRATTSSSW